MSDTHHFLALDFGAESGRGELVTLAGDIVTLEEIHRWPNRPVVLGPTSYWDFPFLFAEVIETLKVVAKRGIQLAGIGVDTWGVDFALLAKDGSLLANPVQYRDKRTDNIHDYANPIMSQEEVFAATAMEPWAIGTLYQLLALQRDQSPLLKAADKLLWMPDLFRYFLCGQPEGELSIAQTSCLVGTNRRLSSEILKRFKLKRKLFPKLQKPPKVVGNLLPQIKQAAGLTADVPVIATAGHDTAAAVAAVPAKGKDWAFISCGTWSIIGRLVKEAVATPEALQRGYSCECTIGSWFTCKNIIGLWLVQELKRQWDTPEDPWDYNRVTARAAEAQACGLINAADESLLAPNDMEAALTQLLADSGQPAPTSRGQLVRTVLESLAAEYAVSLRGLEELTGETVKTLYLVGGGINNRLLCQLTADACGIDVTAGVSECTAVGNGLGQALALGIIRTRNDIRKIARNSFKVTTYYPQDADTWERKIETYKKLQAGA